jgi:hypothetical protein
MKKIVTLVLALFLCLSVYAQSADVITDILESEEITFGQVCYLTAVQMNIIEDSTSYEDAVTALYDKGYIPSIEDYAAPVPAVDLAYLYSKLWKIKGGLMYRITKGSPRYAFRQFQADGIIGNDVDPSSYVSGEKALSIYTSCISKYSDFDMKNVSMEAD